VTSLKSGGVAEDSIDLANRIENQFHKLFASLGAMPRQGHTRRDLTKRPVLFFPLYLFMVVYQPASTPVRIMAVLRGRHNLTRILRERL
jgi:plasmid stabilization system protein ParE